VVENAVAPGYITNKLTDCLAMRTIPIYFGPPVGTIFNADGIIPFASPDEALRLVESLTSANYSARAAAVEDNFKRARGLLDWADDIYVRHQFLF
jgi:hypothetical protein